MAIIAAAAIAVALVTWASQRFAPSSPPPAATTTHASDATVAPPVPAAEPAPAAAAATPVPDTVAAVPFAVRLGELSSYSGAIARLAQEATRGTPAATYAPDTATAGHYVFRLYAGALRTDTAADSLLRQLRARRVAGPDARVARVPYALLVQSGIARDQVASFVSGYDAKGLRVYPLLQSDGSVSLYAGAFESPDQARVLLTTFRARGESPSVTYRTGRTP
jgi:hypothetical protein